MLAHTQSHLTGSAVPLGGAQLAEGAGQGDTPPPQDCSAFSIVTSPGSGVCLRGGGYHAFDVYSQLCLTTSLRHMLDLGGRLDWLPCYQRAPSWTDVGAALAGRRGRRTEKTTIYINIPDFGKLYRRRMKCCIGPVPCGEGLFRLDLEGFRRGGSQGIARSIFWPWSWRRGEAGGAEGEAWLDGPLDQVLTGVHETRPGEDTYECLRSKNYLSSEHPKTPYIWGFADPVEKTRIQGTQYYKTQSRTEPYYKRFVPTSLSFSTKQNIQCSLGQWF